MPRVPSEPSTYRRQILRRSGGLGSRGVKKKKGENMIGATENSATNFYMTLGNESTSDNDALDSVILVHSEEASHDYNFGETNPKSVHEGMPTDMSRGEETIPNIDVGTEDYDSSPDLYVSCAVDMSPDNGTFSDDGDDDHNSEASDILDADPDDDDDDDGAHDATLADLEDSDANILTNLLQKAPGKTVLNVGEILLIVYAYVHRHKLSKLAGSHLLQIVKGLFPDVAENIPSTWKSLEDRLFSVHVGTSEHSVCARCKQLVVQQKCNCETVDSVYVMVHVSVEDQIKLKFKDPDFIKAMEDWKAYRESSSEFNDIRSVADGQLYKSFIQQQKMKPYCLTWKLFIDSIPLSHSSSTAATPVFLMPNEVPLSKRKGFTILAGLWLGDSKPPIDLLLKCVVEDFNRFYDKGLEVVLPSGKVEHIYCTLLTLHADLPAKAQILNMNQYNGKSSCFICYQEGETFRTERGGSIHVFPFENSSMHRTEASLKQDADTAASRKQTTNGIKGTSPLMSINHFKITEGVVVDYMHQMCLGIQRTLMNLWLGSKHHRQRWYCGKKKKDIDSRLLAIRGPSFIVRRPRSLSALKYWKASEYRSFFLYYLVPCMVDILPSAYLEHAVLLSNGLHLLTKNIITQGDLVEAEQCFREFVALMDTMYGRQYMTLNTHGLLHQTHMVRLQGGLHENSCFDFEDLLGRMKKMVHGTQHMQKQIVNNLLNHQMSTAVANSCILSQEGSQLYSKVADQRRIGGKTKICSDDDWELLGRGKAATSLELVHCDTHHMQFVRAKHGKVVFTSSLYAKASHTVDYCIKYTSDEDMKYGLVNRYLLYEGGEAFVVLKELHICDEPVITGNITQNICHGTKRVIETNIYRCAPIRNIIDKCLFVNLPHISVVVSPPNHYERD